MVQCKLMGFCVAHVYNQCVQDTEELFLLNEHSQSRNYSGQYLKLQLNLKIPSQSRNLSYHIKLNKPESMHIEQS